MQLPTLLAMAVASSGFASVAAAPSPETGVVKRDCFWTGEKYGAKRTMARGKAMEACRSAFTTPTTWKNAEERYLCYNLDNNKMVDFSIGLTGPNAGDTRELLYDECIDGLLKEVEGSCEKGGETTYGNWKYRADPNQGQCS